MKTLTFAILFTVYIILSYALFVITGAGWSGFFLNIIGGLAAAIGTWLFTLLWMKLNKPLLPIKISFKLFFPLMAIQILALLFNFGDCGDAKGNFSFFEVLLKRNGWSICHEAVLGNTGLLLSFFTKAAYAAILIVFILFTLRADKRTANQ